MSSDISEHAKQEIDLSMGRIRYREAGEGPAIVFVHGFLVDGRLWDGVVDALADRFRCIARCTSQLSSAATPESKP